MVTIEMHWPPLARIPSLSDDDVHIWCAPLDLPEPDIERLAGALAADERQRAARFHFERGRRHFIAGRATLRVLLAAYLHVEPSHVALQYGRHGKPALVDAASQAPATAPLRFNVSHSDGLAVYAFTRGRHIGIDVERLRPIDDGERIAARFFSPAEHAQLRTVPAHQFDEAFFNCWTRKEAFVKATGEGLARSLSDFDVSLLPGEPARLTRTAPHPHEALRWTLQALDPAVGYVAALAVDARDVRLSHWHWTA